MADAESECVHVLRRAAQDRLDRQSQRCRKSKCGEHANLDGSVLRAEEGRNRHHCRAADEHEKKRPEQAGVDAHLPSLAACSKHRLMKVTSVVIIHPPMNVTTTPM